MTVHLSIWDEWVTCQATQRACPRAIHLDMPLAEARQLPMAFVDQIYRGKPDLVHADGSLEWHDSQGQLHRDGDLPALIKANGTREWWRHGLRHRKAGPASITAKGEGRWYLHGEMRTVGNKRAIDKDRDDLEDVISLSPKRRREMVAIRQRWRGQLPPGRKRLSAISARRERQLDRIGRVLKLAAQHVEQTVMAEVPATATRVYDQLPRMARDIDPALGLLRTGAQQPLTVEEVDAGLRVSVDRVANLMYAFDSDGVKPSRAVHTAISDFLVTRRTVAANVLAR